MSSELILEVALPVPLPKCFEYLPLETGDMIPVPGIRVKVPFGKRQIVGILVATKTQASLPVAQLKRVVEYIDTTSLFSSALLELIQWASAYYHYPLGEVFASALPALLRKGKPVELKLRKKKIVKEPRKKPLILNEQQLHVIAEVLRSEGQFVPHLLQGVTGSGKTEVYLEIVQGILQANKQALILVPEIGLTPQILARFADRFQETIVVIHSGLTERERLNAWVSAAQGLAKIVIGTRSAIFTPMQNLGVIIVDEEHDISFKQQEGFRYHARDLAVMRAHLEKVPVLLGSATPSLESIHNAKTMRYRLLKLPERAGAAVHPHFSLLDLRNKDLDNGLALPLIQQVKTHLEQGGQVLLFLNRRGFAPVLICHACGWFASCRRCDAKLTIHHSPLLLHCHHCGTQRALDKLCPQCSNKDLMPLGQGTQRLEQALIKHFPAVKIARLDRDSTRHKGKLDDILQTIHAGEARILLGTQMLAKGHHFPEVTLVAILNADSGLYSADFRATEHVAQLLIQVAGRAGRAERMGQVVIQTHNPDHPLLKKLLDEGYESFANAALDERKSAELPPFAHLASLRAEAVDSKYPHDFLQDVKEYIMSYPSAGIQILGPAPCLIEKKAGRYRSQLLLQSSERKNLHTLLAKIIPQFAALPLYKKVRYALDVDPLEIF